MICPFLSGNVVRKLKSIIIDLDLWSACVSHIKQTLGNHQDRDWRRGHCSRNSVAVHVDHMMIKSFVETGNVVQWLIFHAWLVCRFYYRTCTPKLLESFFFSFLQILAMFGRRHKRGWASTWLVVFTLNLGRSTSVLCDITNGWFSVSLEPIPCKWSAAIKRWTSYWETRIIVKTTLNIGKVNFKRDL